MSTTILTPEQIETLFKEHDDLYAFGHAIAAAALQSHEVQAWKKDAERYRWLRSPASVDILDVQHWDGGVLDGAALDDAIDTEMKEQP